MAGQITTALNEGQENQEEPLKWQDWWKQNKDTFDGGFLAGRKTWKDYYNNFNPLPLDPNPNPNTDPNTDPNTTPTPEPTPEPGEGFGKWLQDWMDNYWGDESNKDLKKEAGDLWSNKELANLMGNFLLGTMGPKIGQPLDPYPDIANLADPNQYQQLGLDEMMKYIQGGDTTGAEGLISRIMSGEQNILSGDVVNNYWKNTVLDPMMKEYTDMTKPELAAGYGAGGAYFGTNRADAEARALAGTQSEANKALSELALNQLNKNQEIQAGLIPTALGIQPGKINMALNAGQQMNEQQKLKYQEWLRTQPEYSPWTDQALKLYQYGLGPFMSLINSGG